MHSKPLCFTTVRWRKQGYQPFSFYLFIFYWKPAFICYLNSVILSTQDDYTDKLPVQVQHRKHTLKILKLTYRHVFCVFASKKSWKAFSIKSLSWVIDSSLLFNTLRNLVVNLECYKKQVIIDQNFTHFIWLYLHHSFTKFPACCLLSTSLKICSCALCALMVISAHLTLRK